MTTALPQTTRVGEFVGGKYLIVRMLAEGGMGIVYEAQHTVVKRRFAVKFLRPDLAPRREILTRFHREALTLDRIVFLDDLRHFGARSYH